MCRLLGTNNKNETLTFIGLGIGGLALWQRAISAGQQAEAMKVAAYNQAKATKSQADATKQIEVGHIQERLKNSIEHLGNKEASAPHWRRIRTLSFSQR